MKEKAAVKADSAKTPDRASTSDEAKGTPDDGGIRYINLYESERKIYTRKITGFYQRLRRYTGLPLIAGYLLMPWLMIDGRPAMLFDLPERKFHILWMTFWPQDSLLLAGVLIIAAFSLFAVTVLAGRVWCGFTCPQTVWTMMYMSIEGFCEGDRNRRIKLDNQPWNAEKVVKKGTKHALWLVVAFITGVTFVGYFTPIRELLVDLFIPQIDPSGYVSFNVHPAAAFWTLFFTGMTYLNAGFMREQVCKYMCPYARFQSVMYDQDTLAVNYDRQRGEKRGPRKPGEDYKAQGKGDCIDCTWCVQVCPVDIDIRDGLQYECINCGLCVDACNTVMDKIGYPKNLISFTSETALQSGGVHHWFRPRLVGYTLLLTAIISAFTYMVSVRMPLSVDVIRDRGARLYRLTGDQVQNVYTIKINNMDRQAHTYRVTVEGEHDYHLRGRSQIPLEEGEIFTLPLRVSVDRRSLKDTTSEVLFRVTSTDDPTVTAFQKASFIGPPPQ